MNSRFTLAHVGVNTESPEQAEALASLLSLTFDLNVRQGQKSVFAGELFECMKTPYLGKNGHIALRTDDLEQAVAELKEKGFAFRPGTAAYTPEGKLKNIYLQEEFGGFAIHILQA